MPTRLLLSARKRERSALSARCRRKERSRSSSAAIEHVLGTPREGPERDYEGRHEAAALASEALGLTA